MRFERIADRDHPMYGQAMALYSTSFPTHEQRTPVSQEGILEDREYHFNLIYDDEVYVGLLLCWEVAEFIYVEHFCILPKLRNKQYGQKVLKLLCRQKKTVILEIDPPNTPIAIRRKEFYERSGFVENPYTHIHPPYHRENEGHPLVIMTYPGKVSPGEYDVFKEYLNYRVMYR